MEFRKFDPGQTESLISFCLEHGFEPLHPERLLRRFIGNLSSGPEMVFDLFEGESRVAVAVLLDRVQNISNCANLEVLAVDVIQINARDALSKILIESKSRLPNQYSGILLGYSPSKTPLRPDEFAALGFSPYYLTFEMKTSAPLHPALPLDAWAKLNMKDFDAYYSCLKNAFSRSVESSVPDSEAVRESLRAGHSPTPWVRFLENRLAAFVNVADDAGVGEILTVGVHDEFRGRGYGREAVAIGLRELEKLGSKTFKLTVEAENENALGLYKSFGFEVSEPGGCLQYLRG